MPIYIYILCNTTYFITFPEVAIVRCSKKYLFLKYGRKIRAEILEMLEAEIFFQGFARVNDNFADIFRNRHFFCSTIQYTVSKKQAVGKAHEGSADSWETVFDEAYFIVNLHSFLQPLAFPRHTFPPSESFATPPPFHQVAQLPKLWTIAR